MIYYQNMKSPVGKLLVAGNEKGLYLINFPRNDNPSLPGHEWEENPKPLQEVLSQLEAYFAGKLKAFSPGHLFERDTVSKKKCLQPFVVFHMDRPFHMANWPKNWKSKSEPSRGTSKCSKSHTHCHSMPSRYRQQ